MDGIRSSMKDEAKSLKTLVDEITSDNIEQVNKMEESLREMLQSHDKTYQDYISFLEDLIKKFHGYLSSTQLKNNPIIFSLTEHIKIQPIPETTKPVPPVFTAGRYSKVDVAKLLGRITVPDTKSENRKIKPMETASTLLKPTRKQRKQDRRKSDSVTQVREFKVRGVHSVHHISLGKSGRLWVSDGGGYLIQTDVQGNQLQKILTIGLDEGYHTVTQDGDLIYADKRKNVINRIAPYNTITEVIKTGDWIPVSIHSSHINGDILVGMRTFRYTEGKVTRYNKTGTEKQNIQRDHKGQRLYKHPCFITENVNGDICTSDLFREVIVVVNKLGKYRFSYTGQGLCFSPRGVRTDLVGHILVCENYSKTVHLLDQNGQFLSLLLSKQQRVDSVCVDNENNLYVGQSSTNTVTVYKNLQW